MPSGYFRKKENLLFLALFSHTDLIDEPLSLEEAFSRM